MAATVRIALWSAHHAGLVVTAWTIVMIGLFMLNGVLGGTRNQSVMGSSDTLTEAEIGNQVFQDAGPRQVGQSIWVVLEARSGSIATPAASAEVASIVDRMRAATLVVPGASAATPIFGTLNSPLEAPREAGLVAADGTAAMITGTVAGDGADLEARVTAARGLLADLQRDTPDLQVMGLNNTIVNREVGELVNSDLDGSLKLTLPITFLILLLAFGAVVAAFVPIALAVTALIGAFGLIGLYSNYVEPVSQYAGQVIVLIGLAVAVDYSLFLIKRVRSERRAGRSRYDAIEVGSSTAGRAVFFSGMAVAISLAGLLVMNNSIFRSVAVGTICVVLISVIGSLTFLPATLALLGDRIDMLRLPYFGAERPEGTGVWTRLVLFATRRAAPVAILIAAFLLLAGSPVTRLRLGSMGIDGLPSNLPSVAAWNVMAAKWPQGTTLTLDTFVTHADRADTKAAIASYRTALTAVQGIGRPAGLQTSTDGTVVDVMFTLPGGANDIANWDVVRQVRSSVVPAAFAALPDVSVYVSGDAAASMDSANMFGGQTPLVIAFVLTLSFLLMLVVFHSIVIAVTAILLNLLSAGAAFGVLQLVFQDGWFKDQLGVQPAPIEAWVPPMIFTILFGLSMDYHVFILSRVKEARDRGLDSVGAVVKGISVTSGTVTSAAAIMVAVFAVFVTLHFSIIREMGLGLAVAVFLDAALVRSLLLPSSMRLLGDRNWYMPRWLDWIPRITIEGEPEEAVPVGGIKSGSAPKSTVSTV